MGRMDGNGTSVEIVDPRGRIAQLELEVQRLERDNNQLQDERDGLQGRALELEAKLKTGRQCVAERDEEIEWLSTQAKQDQSIVGRGYRSVTVYADGTVEVDRSFDDDDQPASRRTL